MREIKFRAYDKEQKRMIYQSKSICFHIADEFVGIDNDTTYEYNEYDFSWTGSLNTELMQFTGLKDRDGKDIFEGDIVEMETFLGRKPIAKVVTFENGMFNIASMMYMGHKVKIIGNVWQTSSLIKEKKLKDFRENFSRQ